jgi:ABC-2 type transport system ATP-binding protein
MPLIVNVKNLSKKFADILAVDDLSFSVEAGQVYGFLGQNGAGKSTTIRMLLSLVKPDSGHIELFGMDLTKHRKEILRKVGAVIERPDLYKYLSALENVRLFAAMSGKKIPQKRILEQLDRVGLSERVNSKVKTYSQGMKQRLGIAVALVHDPELIILDEPTNGLDPQGIADIRKLVIHLSKEEGKTIFVSSHLLYEMELVADSMLIINKGKKVTEGKKEDLLNPATTQVELITTDNELSVQRIMETKWASSFVTNNGAAIWLEIKKEDIPELNRMLVEKGTQVQSLRPKHSLEDLFLSLTTH